MTFPESARVTQDSNSNKDAAVRIIGLAAANKKNKAVSNERRCCKEL
jgi:hypothetical protein